MGQMMCLTRSNEVALRSFKHAKHAAAPRGCMHDAWPIGGPPARWARIAGRANAATQLVAASR
jgi:hypothetical protein